MKIGANSNWQVQGQDLYQLSATRLLPSHYLLTDYIDIKAILRKLIRSTIYRLHGMINTPEVNGTIPDTVSNLADNCRDSQVVDIICRNDLEPDSIIVVEIPDALK